MMAVPITRKPTGETSPLFIGVNLLGICQDAKLAHPIPEVDTDSEYQIIPNKP